MLTICPTPIGNLEDVSARQRSALAGADVLVCEDTRTTGKLLELLGIDRVDGSPRLVSFHEYSSPERVDALAEMTLNENVVLVSDAGTPSISDPGFLLVRKAIEKGCSLVSIPGPVAAVVGLVASGLPTDRFLFAGFLSAKSAKRRAELEELDGNHTLVLYESPNRLKKLLEDVREVFGEGRGVYVGRELTKLHEEHLHGTADEVLETLGERSRIRGECVVCVAPRKGTRGDGVNLNAREVVKALYDEGLSPRKIKAVGSQLLGTSKSEIYRIIEEIRGD